MTQSTEDLLAERKTTHGEYSEHARCTQAIMTALQRERGWEGLPDIVKESLHMFAHKMGRVVTGNWTVKDHYDDIAGYATLISQRLDDKVGLREGHRPVDLPCGRRPGAPLSERVYELRDRRRVGDLERETVETTTDRTYAQDHARVVENGEGRWEPSLSQNTNEELIQRALTHDDVTRHVQLRDGRRAMVVAWESHNEPYAFRLRLVKLVGEGPVKDILREDTYNIEDEQLPLVNMFGESEAGRWNPTDVSGVWMPKEQQLYGGESGRANIGHFGELGSRLLCEEDIGKVVLRRDGSAAKLEENTNGGGYLVLRSDGVAYSVNKNGFIQNMKAPNAADIRQVLK